MAKAPAKKVAAKARAKKAGSTVQLIQGPGNNIYRLTSTVLMLAIAGISQSANTRAKQQTTAPTIF